MYFHGDMHQANDISDIESNNTTVEYLCNV